LDEAKEISTSTMEKIKGLFGGDVKK